MERPPSLGKETSTRTGRRLWLVTLGIFALALVIGLVFMAITKHVGVPK